MQNGFFFFSKLVWQVGVDIWCCYQLPSIPFLLIIAPWVFLWGALACPTPRLQVWGRLTVFTGSGGGHMTRADQSLRYILWRRDHFRGGYDSSAKPKESQSRGFAGTGGRCTLLLQGLLSSEPLGLELLMAVLPLREENQLRLKAAQRKAEKGDGVTKISGDIFWVAGFNCEFF